MVEGTSNSFDIPNNVFALIGIVTNSSGVNSGVVTGIGAIGWTGFGPLIVDETFSIPETPFFCKALSTIALLALALLTLALTAAEASL